jgi:predicted small secreted protein
MLPRLFLCFCLFAALVAPLSACNTVEGIGRDTRAVGDAIAGSAERTKGY